MKYIHWVVVKGIFSHFLKATALNRTKEDHLLCSILTVISKPHPFTAKKIQHMHFYFKKIPYARDVRQLQDPSFRLFGLLDIYI